MNRADFNAKNRSYMSPDMYAAGQGETLTIRDCREETKKSRDGSKSWKQLQLWWMEERPPLDLQPDNVDFLVSTFGGDDDAWIRRKVFVWHDRTRTRGLALDVPRETPSQAAANAALKAQIASTPNAAPAPALEHGAVAQPSPLAALNPARQDPDDEIPF